MNKLLTLFTASTFVGACGYNKDYHVQASTKEKPKLSIIETEKWVPAYNLANAKYISLNRQNYNIAIYWVRYHIHSSLEESPTVIQFSSLKDAEDNFYEISKYSNLWIPERK